MLLLVGRKSGKSKKYCAIAFTSTCVQLSIKFVIIDTRLQIIFAKLNQSQWVKVSQMTIWNMMTKFIEIIQVIMFSGNSTCGHAAREGRERERERRTSSTRIRMESFIRLHRPKKRIMKLKSLNTHDPLWLNARILENQTYTHMMRKSREFMSTFLKCSNDVIFHENYETGVSMWNKMITYVRRSQFSIWIECCFFSFHSFLRAEL